MENEDHKEPERIKSKKRREFDRDDGFGDWGGYMAAKRAKLLDQFKGSEIPRLSNIFEGVAIHVNGLTRPPIDELKNLMAAHGGVFHMYQVSSTTHIIASNLPNVKIKHLGTTPIVKPSWITESINYGKLLDYRRYLLYTNQSKTQPKIDFPIIEKNNNQEVAEPTNKAATKTASDPNFLEEFYNNSRLHLISTLGAEFKHLVGQMREKSDGIFVGKQKLLALKTNSNLLLIQNTVIMHIDMDCFFVSVSLRKRPDLKGKPVAITHARNGQLTNVKPDQKANREQEFSLYSERLPIGVTSRVDKIDTNSSLSEIASCSYEARQCGIKNGMFLGQAVKLCPELKTLPYDFEGIKSVSHSLYEIIASYTLDIEAVSCDEMYVDVTNILKETGLSVEEWATYIRNEIMNATQCPCSTGFGANRLQARLATKKAKPAGQYYLKSDDIESYMVEIKLSDLPGVGRATLGKLQKMGLNTCGDLQLVSLKTLQTELGQKLGENLKEQCVGIDNRPLNFHHERKSVSAEVNYGIRFKTIEECYNFLQNLSVEVFNRMNDINMRARCLTLKLLVRASEAPMETAKFLGHGICDSLSKSTTSNIVFNNPQIIFKESKILYEKLNPLFSDLRGVGLQLTKLEKNAPINSMLSKFLKQSNSKESVQIEEKLNISNIKQKNIKQSNSKYIQIEEKEDTQTSIISNIKQKIVSKNINGSKLKNKNNNNSGSISNYFEKTKSAENNPKSKQNRQLHQQIDMDVLNELPEDIRKEIMREYNLQEAVKPEGKKRKSQKQKCGKQSNQKIDSEKYLDVDTIQKYPFKNLTWDQIKPIIKKWMESDENPYEFDIEMIAEHFKQLAIDRKIEVLPKMFSYLHRNFSALNCIWHEAYFKIVNITQEGMVARYGGTLLVQRQFECCKM
ncbi:unnamed protein product [Psylliodes chrysocephalus]|uniref:DNA repair protein REV1 n=1 Tax=Psylliodes chrysocephalus TaxID=3402493 RepID=A0A9P0G9S6_9CUCU|nr:unnamed protein product [Psylliodes chrysocephala]